MATKWGLSVLLYGLIPINSCTPVSQSCSSILSVPNVHHHWLWILFGMPKLYAPEQLQTFTDLLIPSGGSRSNPAVSTEVNIIKLKATRHTSTGIVQLHQMKTHLSPICWFSLCPDTSEVLSMSRWIHTASDIWKNATPSTQGLHSL